MKNTIKLLVNASSFVLEMQHYVSLMLTVSILFLSQSEAICMELKADIQAGYDSNPGQYHEKSASTFTAYRLETGFDRHIDGLGSEISIAAYVNYMDYLQIKDNYLLALDMAFSHPLPSYLNGELFLSVDSYRDDFVPEDERDVIGAGVFVSWSGIPALEFYLTSGFFRHQYKNDVIPYAAKARSGMHSGIAKADLELSAMAAPYNPMELNGKGNSDSYIPRERSDKLYELELGCKKFLYRSLSIDLSPGYNTTTTFIV